MLMMPLVIMSMPIGDDKTYMTSLYEQHKCLMFKIAWRYTDEPAEVEEIISDACLSLIKNIATLYKLDRGQVRRYIALTVKSKASDYFCHKGTLRKRFSNLSDETMQAVADPADTEQKIILHEELEAVLRAIDGLPEKEGMVLKLKY